MYHGTDFTVFSTDDDDGGGCGGGGDFLRQLSLYLQFLFHTGWIILRSSNTADVQRTETLLGDRAFSVAGPKMWNNLHTSLRLKPRSHRTRRVDAVGECLLSLTLIWFDASTRVDARDALGVNGA